MAGRPQGVQNKDTTELRESGISRAGSVTRGTGTPLEGQQMPLRMEEEEDEDEFEQVQRWMTADGDPGEGSNRIYPPARPQTPGVGPSAPGTRATTPGSGVSTQQNANNFGSGVGTQIAQNAAIAPPIPLVGPTGTGAAAATPANSCGPVERYNMLKDIMSWGLSPTSKKKAMEHIFSQGPGLGTGVPPATATNASAAPVAGPVAQPVAPSTALVVASNATPSSQTVAGPSNGSNLVEVPEEVQGITLSFTKDPGDLFDHKLRAHKSVVALLVNGHHLPLTLCTTSAMKRMTTDPSCIRYQKQWDSKGVRKELLDANTWPKETNMTREEWRDGWTNFLAILRKVADANIVDMFQEHYDYLCASEEMAGVFPAVLEFDIEIRQTFFGGAMKKFAIGSQKYEKRLSDFRFKYIGTSNNCTQSTPQHRHHPYERPARLTNKPSRGGPSTDGGPFRTGKPGASSELVCLSCGTGGHRANKCSKSTLPNKKPVHCVWYDGKLVEADSRKESCVIWNVFGTVPCNSAKCCGTTGHFCSWCGSTEHYALSKRCL